MGSSISLGIVLLLFLGACTKETPAPPIKRMKDIPSATETLNNFKKENKNNIPQIILPPVYESISVFDGQNITFSAEHANLYKVLYSISKIAGLNLIIDKDVQKKIPITISVKKANLKDVLNIIMKMSGCYYTLSGNILHIKEYMRKRFNISYVHSDASFSTKLGGDTLSTASSGGGSSNEGISGKYTLDYKSPKDANNFYKHLDENIKSLISKKGKYTLNAFSGVLSVYDKKQNIDEISNFIKDIKNQFNKQILIEAKILEVSLNKTHQLGIDWQAVGHNVLSSGDTFSLGQTLGLTGAIAGKMSYSSSYFNTLVNAIDKNGKVDTLSNPRIKVLNGQSAIISSGKLVPYWEKKVDTSQGTSTSNIQVTYDRRNVLDGVTMGVTPTVMDNGRIMLNITPISSSIESEKSYMDGGVSVASAPIINIKEAGTIIYAKDNDLVLIGGLISNTVSKVHSSIPILGDLPLIGFLFRQTDNVVQKKELVILLHVKILQ